LQTLQIAGTALANFADRFRPLQTVAYVVAKFAPLQALHATNATMQRNGLSGATSLPLCQVRDTVGKVLFWLNIINDKGL
jgi:hypothetical protein